MITRPFSSLASLFLMPLTLSVVSADVTLRYKTDVKMNPALPAEMVEATTKAMNSALLFQEHVLRFKDGKGFSTSMGYDSITDFTTKEVTFLDTAGKRYAKLKSDQVGEEMAGAIPELPAGSREAMASMRSYHDRCQLDRPYRRHPGCGGGRARARLFDRGASRAQHAPGSHDQDGDASLDC